MSRRSVALLVVILLVSVLSSCSMTKSPREGAASSVESTRASYFDFDDIIVPSEMKVDKKNSFVYTNSRIKTGVLTFTGRVEPDSLATFFQNNMPKDQWRLLSTVKFRDETMLVFLKENRAAVLNIKEGWFSSKLEIRVGPIEPAAAPAKGGSTR